MSSKNSGFNPEKAKSIIAKAWKDESFKKQLFENPRKVIQKEAGYDIPWNVIPEILEESDKKLFFVLPPKP